MATKKHWNEMTKVAQWRIAILGIIQLGLQFVALRDLIKRPASEVNGSKGIWAAASFLNFVGPTAYLAFGRSSKRR